MRSKHVFALVALILGIVGGVLLCKGAIDLASKLAEGGRRISFESPVLVGIGFVVIIASAMLWKGSYLAGGVINMVLGIVTVFLGKDAEGVIVLISGVLGVVAPKMRD